MATDTPDDAAEERLDERNLTQLVLESAKLFGKPLPNLQFENLEQSRYRFDKWHKAMGEDGSQLDSVAARLPFLQTKLSKVLIRINRTLTALLSESEMLQEASDPNDRVTASAELIEDLDTDLDVLEGLKRFIEVAESKNISSLSDLNSWMERA